MTNRVTIFSNGIADYRKVVEVKNNQPTLIRIPVNKSDVGDVLASLTIFGDVRYTPPVFSPSNDQQGTLRLSSENVLTQLSSKLRGAKATITTTTSTISGQVVGNEDQSEIDGNSGNEIKHRSLVLLANGKFQKIPFQDIREWSFDDDQVKIEIEKALQRSFQNIKPQSTFIESSLTTDKDVENAIVQYITSAAAWKITYRMRNVGNKTIFEGFAVVDNNTEEEWENVIVSVVVGEPISFRTDLADVTIPHRNMVRIVKQESVGAVEAEESMGFSSDSCRNATPRPRARVAGLIHACSEAEGPSGAHGSAGVRGMDSEGSYYSEYCGSLAHVQSAMAPQAEAKEVGDYCIFESLEPVTIQSKRSAMVPVFQAEISQDKAELVLYYKSAQHPDRAYRTIRFENGLDHSLGRGVCTLYNDGVMTGTAVVPATKQGQQQLLPHALETGVKFSKIDKGQRSEVVSAEVSQGIAIIQQATIQSTNYQIKNHKSEKHSVVLDHESDHFFCNNEVSRKVKIVSLKNSEQDIQELKNYEKLKDGIRCNFSLEPNEEILITVRETVIDQNEIRFGDTINFNWFVNSVISLGGDFRENSKIADCIKIQKEIDAIKEQITQLREERNRCIEKQERLRKNISTNANNEMMDKWSMSLAESEDRIGTIEERELPKLSTQCEELNQSLRNALCEVTGSWKKS